MFDFSDTIKNFETASLLYITYERKKCYFVDGGDL